MRWNWIGIVGVVLAASAAQAGPAAEPEAHRIEVLRKDPKTVTVQVDGHRRVITVGDLEDGASRTFGEGEAAVTVTRHGDALVVSAAGWNGVVAAGEEEGGADHPCRRLIVIERDAGAGGGAEASEREEIEERIRERLEAARERMEELRERLPELSHKLETLREKLERMGLEEQAELNELLLERLERRLHALRHLGETAPEVWIEREPDHRAVFRCEKDGVTLELPEEAAAGRTFSCPVCGRPMERAGGRRIERRIVIEREDSGE